MNEMEKINSIFLFHFYIFKLINNTETFKFSKTVRNKLDYIHCNILNIITIAKQTSQLSNETEIKYFM